MFKKVFKYDFLGIIKLWSLFAGICLFGGIISGFYSLIQSKMISGFLLSSLLGTIGTMALYSLPIATIVLLIKNYAGTMFSRRGSLTFMLPVSRSTLYWSKVLTGAVYEVMTTVVLSVAVTITSLIGAENYTNVIVSNTRTILQTFSLIESILILNITVLIEFGFIVGIYEIITGFRLAVVPGGGKRQQGAPDQAVPP